VQTHRAPKPVTAAPVQVPGSSPTSVSKGGGVPKGDLGSNVRTAPGCHRGGDVPVEVRTRWDG